VFCQAEIDSAHAQRQSRTSSSRYGFISFFGAVRTAPTTCQSAAKAKTTAEN